MREFSKVRIFLTFNLFFIFFCSNSQERFIPLPPEVKPEMSGFKIHEGSLVNLSQGVVNISVPIYTIEQDGIQIPIHLQYNTRGIKVNEEASWVGLGWTFDMPKIFQVVNDEDDLERFKGNPFYEGYLLPHSGNTSPFHKLLKFRSVIFSHIYGSYSLLTGNTVSENCDYFIATGKEVPLDDKIHITENIHHSSYSNPIPDIFAPTGFGVDTEPDFFTIQLFDKEIRFIFDLKSGIVEVLNDKLYKINYDKLNNSFTVRTPDEVIYEFTLHRSHNIYFSSDSFDNVSMGGGSSSNHEWLLTKIISNKGTAIDFKYKNFGSPAMFVAGENPNRLGLTRTERDGQFSVASSVPNLHSEKSSVAVSNSMTIGAATGIIESYSLDLTTAYYLDQIVFEEGEIKFDLSSRTDVPTTNNSHLYKKLDRVAIKNSVGESIIIFDFNYSHFITIDTGNKWRKSTFSQDLLRLRLDGITRNNVLYRDFQYNTQSLPNKTSYAVDYWGYFNGKFSNISYAPNPKRFIEAQILSSTFTSYDNGNNHSSDVNFAKAAVLEKMVLPTGGFEKFHYELNEYNSTINNKVPNMFNNSNTVQGVGLRIGRVELFDNILTKLISTKRFRYDIGVLPNAVKFFKKFSANYRYKSSGDNTTDRTYDGLVSSQSNLFSPPVFEKDNIIFYPKVTEEYLSTVNPEESFKISHYYQANSYKYFANLSINLTNFYEVYNPGLPDRTIYSNGTLLRQEFYDSQDNLLLKKNYEYYIMKSALKYGVKTRYIGVWSGYNTSSDVFQSKPQHSIEYYPIYYDSNYPKSIEEVSYFGNDSISSIVLNNYDAKWRISQTKKTDGPIDHISKVYAYNSSFLEGVPNRISIYRVLNNKMTNGYSFFDYEKKVNISNTAFYSLKSISECKYSGSPEINNSCFRTFFKSYNSKGKLTEYQDENHVPISFIWGSNSQHPIAKIENATYAEVAAALNITVSALDNYTGSFTALNNLRTNINLSKAMVTTYTYSPLIGITSIIDPKGNKITYYYDSFNRLEYIKDVDGKLITEHKYNYKSN